MVYLSKITVGDGRKNPGVQCCFVGEYCLKTADGIIMTWAKELDDLIPTMKKLIDNGVIESIEIGGVA